MKKTLNKYIAAIFILVIVFSMSLTANAQGSVVYDGNAKEFIFSPGSNYSPTDLFPDFKGVMPGDSITQGITVKNDEDNEVKVNIYLRALGATKESEELLSKLHMTVAKSEINEMAYMFDAAANETDGLSEWVLIGTLYSGGKVDLEVTLDVPIELGNEYQDAVGSLEWEFKVEELPIDPDDPKPPQTGESSMIYILLAVIPIILAVMIVLVKRKRA